MNEDQAVIDGRREVVEREYSPAALCCSHLRLLQFQMGHWEVRRSRSIRYFHRRIVHLDSLGSSGYNCSCRPEPRGYSSSTSSSATEQRRTRTAERYMSCNTRHWIGIYCSLQGGQRMNMGSRRVGS